MSNKLFPLLFTLERVENGYILTSKEEGGSLTKEAEFRKEVVIEDKINARIGQLLHLDKMNKEQPVVFYVEHVNENTYKSETEVEPDATMDAKLHFIHFNAPKKNDGTLVLHIKDTNQLEIYGAEAEAIAKANNLALLRSVKTPYLRFAASVEGKKALAAYCNGRLSLMEVTTSQISKWYSEHKIIE
ncbi:MULTISPECIES: hypothetical protein [Bacteroides]|jgi:hypothetical protein|uniref:Uncharacterized protein n=1 Tax=Bacteroides uniformis TaxID=820 RepID=A0A3E4R8X9_BACUN|nr:hypothetical protein [Bacteroides uniformis]RGL16269.1 hypothetical protein DXC80_03605 [Bacteroides uniformis]